ncbi:MAG TPA: tetratricopeptide repeat protein, partial [Ktedonobacteraceae bacterium]
DRYEVAAEVLTIMLKTNYVEDRWRSVALGWCGYLHLLAGQNSQALVNLTEAIQLAPEIVKYWVNRGWIYFCMNCFEEAIADFTHAIEMIPDGGGVIFLRGFVHQRLKHYDEALADFTHAIELMPNIAEAIRRRGQVYWELKHYDEALEDFDRVIELMPDVAGAVGLRGQVHWELNHYDNALKDFDSAIALDRTLTNSLSIDRALLLCKLGRYAEAIETYDEGLNQNPNRSDLLYNFAIAVAHLKGIQEARIYIDKARVALLTIKNTDARATAFYGLGGLEVLMGDNDQALDYLQQAIMLDKEAKRWARHDIVWTALNNDRRYQNLIS